MREVIEELERALADVEERRMSLERVLKDSGTALASAERRLRRALGGVSLDRWRALANGKASIRSPASGKAANVAARRAPAVELALQEWEVTRFAWSQRIDEARTALDLAEQAFTASGRHVDTWKLTGVKWSRTADPEIALQEEAFQREVHLVSTRHTVKEYQRRLVELDAEHSRAQRRLDAARGKRDEVVAVHEQQVGDAEREVEKTVVAMAIEVGPELAANVLDLDVVRVRQLVRRASTAQ